MADLGTLEFKIKNGMKLTPAELHTMTTTLDEKGVFSRRRWTGLKEYPDSQVDLPGRDQRP